MQYARAMTDLEKPGPLQPSLLALFAHPDDEAFSSGGTLAHYAGQGVRVHLICTTRGEVGKITDPELGEVTDVGAFREQELRRACEALGIEAPTFLDYHDSGRLERLQKDDPLASINADPLKMEAQILEVLKDVKPQVMLTFDPHGGYGHPDHLVIHRAALGAFFQAGRLEHVPQRLFYTARTFEDMDKMAARAGENPANGNRGPFNGLDPRVYGVSSDTLAVLLDVSHTMEQKKAAVFAHRSQIGPNSAFANMQPERMNDFFGSEGFALGGSRGPILNYPLRGFFDGLGFDGLE